jgi:hypothetical protein
MFKLFKNAKLQFIVLFALVVIIGLTITFVVGPPDEAPPFITPGP